MQGRAPDEGPSGGGPAASKVDEGRQSITANAAAKERHDPKRLRAVAKKYVIDSTKSLVTAYNTALDDERAVLLGWLRNYDERSDECLKPKTVLEYAELAKITPRSLEDKGILKNLVCSLRSCIRPREFVEEHVAAALCMALELADPSTYGGVGVLVVVSRRLLNSLSREPRLTRENFAEHEATFLALRRTLLLISEKRQSGVYETEKRELRQSIAEKETEMELSCKHYPVSFHFKTLRQAVERIETEDASSYLAHAMQHIGCGLCGFLYVLHCIRDLAKGDIDPVAVQDAYSKARAAIANVGVSKKPWFDSFKNLMISRQEVSKDETKLALFETNYDAAMKHQRNVTNAEDLKALRYGIVRELRTLALEGLSENAQDVATAKLVNLATDQAVDEGWTDDGDILIALLDAIYELHGIGRCDEDAKNALLVLHKSCKGFAEKALTEWMGGNSMEEKLRERSPQRATVELKDLCIKIGRDMGYIPLAIAELQGEELRSRYLRDDFATVTSLFEDGSPKHVKDMKHHVVISEEIIEKRVMPKDRTGKATQRVDGREGTSSDRGGVQAKEHYEKTKRVTGRASRRVEEREGTSADKGGDQADEYYEKKTMVTKPIALEDLFTRRSLKPGDPVRDVRRVLLYGNPGSGKTCITKVVAHKWALGKIAQDLNAIYVVPVRVLNSAEYNGRELTRLEGAISQICFCGSQHVIEHEDLVSQVEDELDDPSTLLMLDGLDEANDHARELVSAEWKRSCKVLLPSRPYNMRDIETRVDIQVECLGFNDEQLRNYIRSELSEDEAPRLIRSLENTTAMWEMAHIPVTAHILCSLSKEHGGAIEEEGKRASTFQIYNDMANYVWKRFEEKTTARNIQKMELFKDLEKIAFESLRGGLILIHERFVMQHATSKNAVRTFKESGFLLLVLEGQEYQFPHLTYQEYFAGRFIARILKQRGSDAEMRVLDFIRDGKYDAKRALTLTFAMHAFAVGRSKQALEELLSIIDKKPVEVLGIRHYFLRMRVLEATLEEADEDEIKALAKDENTTALVKSASHLLESTIDHVLIREIVVEEFKNLPRVLERLPRVLDDTVDGVKNILASSDYLERKKKAKIKDVLKLVRHSPKHSNEVTQFILQMVQMAEHGDRWCASYERIRRLKSVATYLPQHAGELLPTLSRGCIDEDWTVQRLAIKAIDRVAAAAPQHAGELLSTLASKCNDAKRHVRQGAMEAIVRVAEAAPLQAGEYLPTLASGCNDEEFGVQRAAMEAIGRVASAAPQFAGEYLPTLASGYNEKDWGVQRAAMEAIGHVTSAAPQFAGEYLPTLDSGFIDKDEDVRRAAREAISRVATAAPQFAGQLLSTLADGYYNEDEDIRRARIEYIGRVVLAAPQHAGQFLSTLASKSNDEDEDLDLQMIEAIERVASAAPQHAGQFLSTVARACCDEDSEVRNTARKVLASVRFEETISSAISLPSTYNGGSLFFFVQNSFTLDPATKLKTVPFVLHTTSSQEIGEWDKEVVDVFIGCLVRECDEKFPRLLENICIKE